MVPNKRLPATAFVEESFIPEYQWAARAWLETVEEWIVWIIAHASRLLPTAEDDVRPCTE